MLMEAYMKRYDALRVFNTVDLQQVRALKEKMDQREAEVDRLRRELEEAKRGQNDVIRSLQAEVDVIKRALTNPESGPLLWKTLKDLEEKTR